MQLSRPWHAFYPEGLPPRDRYPAIPLQGFVERAAAWHPHKLALVDGAGSWSYAELHAAILSGSGWIRAQGVEPGDRVLLRMGNRAEFILAYYAALRAGAIVVASSPLIGEAELRAQVADASPRLVLDMGPGDGSPVDSAPQDIAVLQYTSGTTGAPKGAIMSHRNLVANALQNARWFGWRADEVNLAILPLCHTWGMCTCMNSTFAVGGTLVLADRFVEEEAFDLVERHQATVLYGSATMFHRLLDRPPRRLGSLRHVKAGAMLSQGDLKRRWDERYPHAPLQQGYGLTEASPESHNNPPARFKAGTVGVPLQDTDCRIVDGEVQLRGPQVTRGYWNRPEATREAFDAGWLRTGDVGVMDEEGYLSIVDRKKDMLKFRGYTVSPNAVEERLLRHPAVKEAVVVGRPDEREGEIPIAFVVLLAEASDRDLDAHCRAGLAHYEVPREFRRIAEIPRNPLGKPLRRILRGDSAKAR